MPKNDLVVKSNQVIEASYTLTTIEQRLILSAIAQIPKGEPVTDEVIYTVSVADLQKFGANETTAYRDLKESVSRLLIALLFCVRVIEQAVLDGFKKLISWTAVGLLVLDFQKIFCRFYPT